MKNKKQKQKYEQHFNIWPNKGDCHKLENIAQNSSELSFVTCIAWLMDQLLLLQLLLTFKHALPYTRSLSVDNKYFILNITQYLYPIHTFTHTYMLTLFHISIATL